MLVGHATIESTVRYLGADVQDALELSERTEVRPNRLAPVVDIFTPFTLANVVKWTKTAGRYCFQQPSPKQMVGDDARPDEQTQKYSDADYNSIRGDGARPAAMVCLIAHA